MTAVESPVVAGPAPAAFLRDFDTVADALPEAPEFLRALRRRAFEQFASTGFPTTKNEDWHFTSPSPIVESEFLAMTAPGGEVSAEEAAAFAFAPDWHTAVFVNGRFTPELSSLDALPAGVRVLPFARALAEAPELVERYLGRIAGFEDVAHAFTALNTAYLLDGALVHVAKEVALDRPIHLLYVSDALAARGIVHPRTLVVVDRHAKAELVESYAATGDAHYFTNAVTEVALADGATLTHLRLQRESRRAFHVGTVVARQSRDSHYVSFGFVTGAQLSRQNVYTSLDGPGSGATLNGLCMLDDEQHADHQTLIVHAAPDCYSRELYKFVLDGASHGVFNGKVYVHPEAQKTDGKQTNNTLLLSERAKVDTKPQLEIFADDVKCTHGATVGRIDQAAAFYLKSRGVGAELARRLLTYAFAADVLETLEDEAVKVALEAATLERFTRAG